MLSGSEERTGEDNKQQACSVRFVFDGVPVRGVWVNLQGVYQAVCEQKTYGRNEKILLGEALVASVLLSRTIKLQGRLALQARGSGKLKLLIAECTDDAAVRGVVSLQDVPDRQSLPSMQYVVGDGYLAVTLLPDNAESYQGIVPLHGVRLQDCLGEYFMQSEQLPTALWLAANGDQAVGLLLQALPSSDENREEIWQHLHILASTVTNDELLSLSCVELLYRLFHEESVQLFPEEPVRFQCTCNAERSRRALAILGRDELHRLFADQPVVVIDCEFCGASYRFDAGDMVDILGEVSARLH